MFRPFPRVPHFPALQAEQNNQIKGKVLAGRPRYAFGDTTCTEHKDANQEEVCLFGKCFSRPGTSDARTLIKCSKQNLFFTIRCIGIKQSGIRLLPPWRWRLQVELIGSTASSFNQPGPLN